MILQCSNCGAPLQTERVSGKVRCRYCRAVSAVGSLQTQHRVTPPWYRPPPVWIPPPQYNLPSTPLRAQLGVELSVFMVVVLVFVAPLIALAIRSAIDSLSEPRTRTSSQEEPRQRAKTKPTSAPLEEVWPVGTFRCSSGTHSFRFVQSELANAPIIHAEGTCVVMLDHAALSGTGIVAEGNAKIVLDHSDIHAKATFVTANGNAEVDVNRSHVALSTGASLFDLHNNAVVVLQGSPIDGACRATVADNATASVTPAIPCALGKGAFARVTGLTSPVQQRGAKRR